MEEIHGVDVSWLHHSPKDHNSQKSAVTEKPTDDSPAERTSSDPTQSLHHVPRSNGTAPHQSHHQLHRPHLTKRASSEQPDKPDPVHQTPTKNQKDTKSAAPGRRSSWVSSLSSKFSSNSNAAAPKPNEGPPATKVSRSPPVEYANPFAGAVSSAAREDKKTQETSAITPPGSPGKTGHGFLQSAMRRLSSSGGGSIGKAAGTGGVCPRKTMNIDLYRERCSLPELELRKLRRVAFCVDVEIAGAAQYPNAEPEGPETPPPSLDGVSSLTRLEQQIEERRRRKDELKKGEGEALKRPTSLVEEKENDGVIKTNGENVPPASTSDFPESTTDEPKEPTKKKEKKKRSEGERKERKERKQREALANGKIPAEIHRESSNGSTTDSHSSEETPSKAQDRPTTDPLRIYRRCCQLRETPILKRIAEQISNPSASQTTSPGVLLSLDLSGYWMQLPDIITLGDYLAVVPIKKLIMENCGLGDEAVRVILAGLLAAKTPEQAKYNKKLVKKHPPKAPESMERLGVVEKVSFKNNPKISKEGWRHIALFIHMSRSLKAIDLSMIPFPQYSARSDSIKSHHSHHSHDPTPVQIDMPNVIQEAISGRLAGDRLEELVMAECNLSTDVIGQIVDAVIKCGSTRLGLASNDLTREGLEHVLRYVRSGKCEGLDIGGNNLRDHLDDLAGSLDEKCPLFALSLADCRLAPSSLEKLLPALSQLPNFRFIDLSHNRDLFAAKPSALKFIRKQFPRFPLLKRIHLLDVSMTPEHAIALAEVLPECTSLAHLNILENHLISPLANAKTETEQEEACALYASFMAAVRVSNSLICVDIDVPSPESSEIVKALAKQVVAYSLRNLERLPLAETSDSAIAAMTEPHGGELGNTVPDILLHLVGHVEGYPENHDNDEPAPDDDYIVGGTGVVKALDICLKRAADGRKNSLNASPIRSGTGTPQKVLQESEMSTGKAKDMSKNLLGSARKIRARLQPALVKEARSGNDMNYRRLQFLDSTLTGMIQRFEDEYPETRLTSHPPLPTDASSDLPSPEDSTILKPAPSPHATPDLDSLDQADDPDATSSPLLRPASLSHRTSSTSLASRQAQEEGRMHRFGQKLRRDILRPEMEDHAHGTTGAEEDAPYLKELRRRLEHIEGPEIQDKVSRLGPDAVLAAIGASAEELARMEGKGGEGCKEVKAIRIRAMEIWREELDRAMEGKEGGKGPAHEVPTQGEVASTS